MNTEFFNALDALEAERVISKAHMMEKIEAALTRAYQREKGGLENVKVVMDEAKKDIKVYQVKRVVEVVECFETEISLEDAKKIHRRYALGDLVDVELKTKNFGRISALAAKPMGDLDNDALALIRMTEEEKARGRVLVGLASVLQFTLPRLPVPTDTDGD